jgi:predicted PurR-regulated permease PerM
VTLQVLFIAALIAGSAFILQALLPATIWAVMIVVATWPLLLRVQSLLGGRRSFAVAAMTVALLLVLVVPLYLGIAALISGTEELVARSKSPASLELPAPPDWVEGIPVIGQRLDARWQQIADTDRAQLAEQVSPHVRQLLGWLLARVGGLGMMLIQFILTLIIAAALYANGETAADGARRFARRLAGEQGESVVDLAGQAVRAVALGVIVTAIVQSALGGIGLAIAGVPFAAVLTAVMFVTGVAQIGPMPVLVPAIVWLYWSGDSTWGTVLLVWAIPVGGLDNVLRPILIKRGADLPLFLIIAGVIGGLIALGVVGLFIGPVVLAVAYTLLIAWVQDGVAATPSAPQLTEAGAPSPPVGS